MRIADLRREYNLASLRRRDLATEPLTQFQKWFDQAAGTCPSGRLRKRLIQIYKSCFLAGSHSAAEPNTTTLATADKEGRPSARVVLLKGVDERGFIFFTSYESHKARDLAENPRAALVFYWADQERQVCVAGDVTKLAREESAAYFTTRPRGSRLAAWASWQSAPVANRAVLEQRLQELEARFPTDDVPMPPYWGGYLLSPQRVEFWQGRPGRLHDRFCYVKQPGQSWRIDRLCP